jgi:hypothetical protein
LVLRFSCARKLSVSLCVFVRRFMSKFTLTRAKGRFSCLFQLVLRFFSVKEKFLYFYLNSNLAEKSSLFYY